MGQAAAKHARADHETLCDAAARAAPRRCGKRSAAAVLQVAVLQEVRQWSAECEQEAGQLHGQQVQQQQAAELKSEAGAAATATTEAACSTAAAAAASISSMVEQLQEPQHAPVECRTGSANQDSAATSSTAPAPAEDAAPESTAAADDNTASEAETDGQDSDAVQESLDCSAANWHDAAGCQWERTPEGWQQLLQRAFRGEQAAVMACAQELIQGGDFCAQDFGLARELLHTTIPQSCGTACLWLGQLGECGLGLPAPDYEEAAAWFGHGAALGHLECAHALAFCYQHGLGISQDTEAAVEWYAFAADRGFAASQNNLGAHLLLLQRTGGGTTAASDAAVRLLMLAADQGSETAWHNLAVCQQQLGVRCGGE